MSDKVSAAREKAELEKLAAETEKVKLDTLKLKADLEEARVKLQEVEAGARKAKAEALTAEHDAQLRAISLRDRERSERLITLGDYYHHHYTFDAPVDDRSVRSCLATLSAWHREDPECEMNITINSPGGSVIDGFHLFDQLSAYSLRGGGGHKVTMTVRGYACSMAGILLQAADVRQIGAESFVMVHEVATFARGKIGELQDEMKFLEKISERVANIFVSRSGGKTDMKKFKAGWTRSDWWLDSTAALERGFVDKIA